MKAARLVSYGLAAAIAGFATAARAQANVDEHRTTPVPHRYIHGILGDAEFQIALPDSWNGEFLMGARGFSGDENSSGAFKTVGLQKGYAYALSDQGCTASPSATIPRTSTTSPGAGSCSSRSTPRR